MLANWVQETTATIGDGPITMGGAIAGYIALSDAFPDGHTASYTIKDGNNRETGIGTYSAGVLTRATVFETLVDGVFNSSSPAPINLSGSAIVAVTATTRASMNAVYYRPTRFGRGIVGDNLRSGGVTVVTRAANRIYLALYQFSSPLTVSKLTIDVNTAGAAGEVAKCGIYACDVTTKTPGALIYETPDMLVDATGFVSDTSMSQFTLQPGWYWVAYITGSATAKLEGYAHQGPGGNPGGVDNYGFGYGTVYESNIAGWAGAGNLPPVIAAGNEEGFYGFPRIVFNAVSV